VRNLLAFSRQDASEGRAIQMIEVVESRVADPRGLRSDHIAVDVFAESRLRRFAAARNRSSRSS
jgi:hypothetical protein